MPRHVFIGDCEQCGAEAVEGSHQPGHVFACTDCRRRCERDGETIITNMEATNA